jgi:hypothetical protein
MVAAGQAMDDYKIYRLLTNSITEAGSKGNAAAKAKAKEAQAYMDEFLKVNNGDMEWASGGPPYLGRPFMWGYEQYYDDWRERMLRYAVAIKSGKWIE